MKTIFLIRHCETVWQDAKSELTTDGVEKSHRLAIFLKTQWIKRIISSPYERAKQTILPLSKILDVTIEYDERLIEKKLSDIPLEDWKEKLKKSFEDMDIKYNWWESSKEAKARGVSVIKEVIGDNNDTTAIITHWALMILILQHFDTNIWYDEWKSLKNPDIYKISFLDDKNYKLMKMNFN